MLFSFRAYVALFGVFLIYKTFSSLPDGAPIDTMTDTHWAMVILGGILIVQYAIKIIFDQDSQGKTNYELLLTGTSLNNAVISADLEQIRNELKDKSKLNATNSNGFAPLNVAAWQGDSKVVKYLLDAGADINVKDKLGSTALHHAFFGYENRINSEKISDVQLRELIKTVNLLVNKGIDVNAVSPNGTSALQGASCLGSVELVDILVEHGAIIDICGEGENGLTPLAFAITENDTDIVKTLLDHGAKLKVNDEADAENLVQFAKKAGANEQIVKLLEQKQTEG